MLYKTLPYTLLLYGKQGTADFGELRHKKSHITLRSCRVGLNFHLTTLIEIAVYIERFSIECRK